MAILMAIIMAMHGNNNGHSGKTYGNTNQGQFMAMPMAIYGNDHGHTGK